MCIKHLFPRVVTLCNIYKPMVENNRLKCSTWFWKTSLSRKLYTMLCFQTHHNIIQIFCFWNSALLRCQCNLVRTIILKSAVQHWPVLTKCNERNSLLTTYHSLFFFFLFWVHRPEGGPFSFAYEQVLHGRKILNNIKNLFYIPITYISLLQVSVDW